MGICRCGVAGVDAGGDQFLTAFIVSNFSFRAAGQRGLIDVHETEPFRTKCRSSYIEVKLQCGFGLDQPFPTNCVSTFTSCGETAVLHMLAELFAPYACPPQEIIQ